MGMLEHDVCTLHDVHKKTNHSVADTSVIVTREQLLKILHEQGLRVVDDRNPDAVDK